MDQEAFGVTTLRRSTAPRNGARWRYAVQATLVDEAARDRYIEWLLDGHVDEVCHWALGAEVVIIQRNETSDPVRALSIYWFESPEHFAKYEAEGAPSLRAEGIALAERLGGIQFQRELGWAWPIGQEMNE